MPGSARDVRPAGVAGERRRGRHVLLLVAAALAAHLHGRAGARMSTFAPASEIAQEVTFLLDEIAFDRAITQ